MNRFLKALSHRARAKRAVRFRGLFSITPETRILDLGSQDGSHIHQVLSGTNARPENVYIADINAQLLKIGHARFGYAPVEILETGRLPFPDKFFDIVFCSSVIEHVTVIKRDVWLLREEFEMLAAERQAAFAAEIRRVTKAYFVQTPNRAFPIESHTWLPFVGWLPRSILIRTLRITNRVWIKKTKPDWRLLDKNRLAELFPDGEIKQERVFGLTKSIIAVKRD